MNDRPCGADPLLDLLIGFIGCDGTGKSTQIHMLEKWFSENGLKSKSSREPGGSRRGEIIRTLLMNRKTGFSEEEQKIINLDLVRMAETIGQSGSKNAAIAEHVLTLSGQRLVSFDLEIVLFVMARLIHYEEEIKPYLEGKTPNRAFILDRFWPCTFAYQICARTKEMEDEAMAEFMNKFFDWHVWYLDSLGVRPQFILLDTDFERSWGRIHRRSEDQTDFDKLAESFHASTREGYLTWHNQCTPSHVYPRFRATSHLVDATPSPEQVFDQVKRIVQLRMDGTSSSGSSSAVA